MTPSISIVTCCYNPDLKIFKKSLKAIAMQNYPKNLIEHIVMDAGSTNGADTLAVQSGCILVRRPDLLEEALVRMALGIKKAQNDILLFLEPDNIVVGKNWLKEMVQPFIDDKEVVGTFSVRNGYNKSMPVLTKYYALIGANDPTLHYLCKSEKMTHLQKIYKLGKIASNKRGYFTVEFDRYTLPTLGDNGHMVRRKLIAKTISDPHKFLHTDAFFQLLIIGHKKYAGVNNSIIHYAGGSILNNLVKRASYKNKYYRSKNYKRVYHVFSYNSKKDIYNLIKFVMFSITIIQPLTMSVRGYIKSKEVAWFLHPIMCVGTVIAYSVSEARSLIKYAR